MVIEFTLLRGAVIIRPVAKGLSLSLMSITKKKKELEKYFKS